MLGASRLPAVGVFLMGVFLGASVCGAGRPGAHGADQGSRAIPAARSTLSISPPEPIEIDAPICSGT